MRLDNSLAGVSFDLAWHVCTDVEVFTGGCPIVSCPVAEVHLRGLKWLNQMECQNQVVPK